MLEFFLRWGHFLAGVTWIGLLYYFNFVQGDYFKEATPEAKADAVKKLAPRALWWFRWGAMFTFLTGALILANRAHYGGVGSWTLDITLGALMGTLMFLNVWLIIWPAQKIVCGIVEGDAGAAGPKALLASRTNTLLSAPMLLFMAGSGHGSGVGYHGVLGSPDMGFWLVAALVVLIQINAVVGKLGPIASVKGVIHSSIALSVVMWAIMSYL